MTQTKQYKQLIKFHYINSKKVWKHFIDIERYHATVYKKLLQKRYIIENKRSYIIVQKWNRLNRFSTLIKVEKSQISTFANFNINELYSL
jgi:hypothetical protein